MIDRYSRPEMARIWSEENRFQKWLQVELWAAEALSHEGRVPPEVIPRIKKRARVDVNRIRGFEKKVKHEVIAFLRSVAESVGDDARFIHRGLTSSDVMDTGFALQLKEASALLLEDIR
ncbi:MAG: lyase family protein, partial [Candidatus Binatia bacterium]